MLVSGLSPGLNAQDQYFSQVEKNKLEQEIHVQQEAVKKEAAAQEAQKEEVKQDHSKYAMNDYNLKELLFLMSSRGNSATIEKLAQLLKKEKEMISRLR